MSKDKEYIVDKPVDLTLTEEEKQKLRMPKKPPDVPHKRQDIFIDRRDPFAEKPPTVPERRKQDRDRRDT